MGSTQHTSKVEHYGEPRFAHGPLPTAPCPRPTAHCPPQQFAGQAGTATHLPPLGVQPTVGLAQMQQFLGREWARTAGMGPGQGRQGWDQGTWVTTPAAAHVTPPLCETMVSNTKAEKKKKSPPKRHFTRGQAVSGQNNGWLCMVVGIGRVRCLTGKGLGVRGWWLQTLADREWTSDRAPMYSGEAASTPCQDAFMASHLYSAVIPAKSTMVPAARE